MKYLRRGIQYRVSDLGNGRVRKLPHSVATMAHLLRSRGDARGYVRPLVGALRLRRHNRRSINGLRARLGGIDPALLGNPTFLDGRLAYDQDFVTPIEDVLRSNEAIDLGGLATSVVDNIIALWSYGIADVTYNITLQYGVTGTGNVILLDLGELTFDSEQVLRDIEAQKWLASWSFKWLAEKQIESEFAAAMQQHLSPATLKAEWARNRGG